MKLGKAFSDSVFLEKKSQSPLNRRGEKPWWIGTGRPLLFTILLFLGFFILVVRLFDLTFIQGHHLRALADDNRTRELTRHAPRGLLLDRTGKPLVRNIPHYRLITPCEQQSENSCTKMLTKEEGEAMQEKGLPSGYFLEVDYQREYIYPTALSHVLGYTGELNAKELTDEYYILRKYHRGDRVGRMGVEALYEDRLRGRNGRELVEVDAQGKILRTLGRDPEIPGEDITLSIDASLAEVVERSFPAGKKGAVIVSKPQTGEILALYSSPSFSLNSFSIGMSQEEYTRLMNGDDRPMFDRAIGGIYPPGSTYKLVTSMAAIEEGVIKPDTVIEDTGVITLGQFRFPNWYFLKYGKTEGLVDLTKALQRSNDSYFYKIGEALGISKLTFWSRQVGIGKLTGIEIAGESAGLVPDPAWKKGHFTSQADMEARQGDWYLGDTYHMSIGQGYLLTTPIQVSQWLNIVANGGQICRPTIRKTDARLFQPQCTSIAVKPETLKKIERGMQKACETGGTGWPLFDFSVPQHASDILLSDKTHTATTAAVRNRVPIACKTGTAEFGDPHNNTHAWFVSYAPFQAQGVQAIGGGSVITGDPEISIVVLVEEGGEGSDAAAPVAKKIYEAWFAR